MRQRGFLGNEVGRQGRWRWAGWVRWAGWDNRSRPISCQNFEHRLKQGWAPRPRTVNTVPPCCVMKNTAARKAGKRSMPSQTLVSFETSVCGSREHTWLVRMRLAKNFPLVVVPPCVAWLGKAGSALSVLPGSHAVRTVERGGMDPYYRQTRGAPLPCPRASHSER